MRAARGYIWSGLPRSDAAALSSTARFFAKKKKKIKTKGEQAGFFLKKGTGLEGASGLFLVHLGPNANLVWAGGGRTRRGGCSRAGVCHYLLFEKSKNPNRIVGMESKEHYESGLKF